MKWNATAILDELRSYANPESRQGMARFGIQTEHALGVSIPVLRRTAKKIGKNHELALELWSSGIHEARILASMIDDPLAVTVRQMRRWSAEFDSWDLCDQCCMNLFSKTPHAWKQAFLWTKRKGEFEKRAAFALLACLAWYEGPEADDILAVCLPHILHFADDSRTYVKKAVSWALRNIGKRNALLCQQTLEAMYDVRKSSSAAVRWIASDVIRELESAAVQKRLEKKKGVERGKRKTPSRTKEGRR